MSDILKHIIDLLKDKATSIGFKTALFFSIIGVIFLTDNFIGFSYNYHINNKLEQLEKIQSLKTYYQNDISNLKNIEGLEEEILNKRHYKDAFTNVFTIKSKDTPIAVKRYERSILWMFLSSNYGLIIAFFILLFLPLKGVVHRTGENLLGLFAMLVILVFIMWFLTWLAYLIPLLWGKTISKLCS